MTYKFVTLNEVSELQGLPYKDATWKLHDICIRLLSERDAYRFLAAQLYEGQILPEPGDWMELSKENQDDVDSEAARIMEKQK